MGMEGLKAELIVEFIGTFMLTYTFATYQAGGQHITAGAMLTVLTYWAKDISGAGFNPAVTLTQVLMGRLGTGEGSWLDTLKRDWKALLMYWGVQFGAAICAAILGYSTRPDDFMLACVQPDNKKFNFAEAFLNEWIWTAILCYVVIVMLYTKEMEGNYAYGFSIGMTFTAAGVSAPISGGGLNPAMSFGLWFSSTFNKYSGNDCAENGWANMWYFLLAPIAGAFSAWLIHRITHEARWEQWHDVIMEFFGTFFLTYAMCTTIVAAGAGFISIGFLVAVLVYVGFHKKSGHYNPVVSLAVWINKGLEGKRFGFYCAAQCTAAFAAAIIGYLTTRYDNNLTDLEPYHPKAAANENKFGALLANFIFTSFVAFTYLVTMAQVHKTGIKANPFFGIIIGFSIMAGYGTVGNFTSSIFNPAIWLGSSLVYLFSEGGDDVGEIYIYAISGFGGAVAAAFFYKLFVGDPFEGTAFDSEEGQLERDREAMRAASSRRTGGGTSASSSGGAGGAGAGGTVMTSNPVATAPTDGKPAAAAADSSV